MADPRGLDAPDPSAWPVPDLARDWFTARCPIEVAATARDLEHEGLLLLGWLRTWTDDVQATLDRYEAAVGPHHLSDDHHHLVTTLAGIDRLHHLLDDLTLTAAGTH